jgi:LCP family protein required for cell wall assembly
MRKNRVKTNKKNSAGSHRFVGFTRILAIVYLFALFIFELAMLMIDIFSAKMLLVMTLILGALGALLFFLLFSRKTGKKARVAATALSCAMIAIFAVGSVYSAGTLSFLNKVSNSSGGSSDVTNKSFNMYITGIDAWGKIDEKGRSDVNMLVTVNPKTHTILLTSIPRDYQIRLMNYNNATDKLTHTGFYGVDDTISSAEDLLGVNIGYYVKVNFSTVRMFIDSIGGIDVVSQYNFTSHYGGDGKTYTFKKGKNHLNGRQALAFARERHSFTTGDVQRIKNEQIVFSAMVEKATSSTTMVTKYSQILSSLSDYFATNMSSSEIRSLVKMQLSDNQKWTIKKNNLTGSDGEMDTYTAGTAYIMVQDPASISHAKKLINQVMDSNGSVDNVLGDINELYEDSSEDTLSQNDVGVSSDTESLTGQTTQ